MCQMTRQPESRATSMWTISRQNENKGESVDVHNLYASPPDRRRDAPKQLHLAPDSSYERAPFRCQFPAVNRYQLRQVSEFAVAQIIRYRGHSSRQRRKRTEHEHGWLAVTCELMESLQNLATVLLRQCLANTGTQSAEPARNRLKDQPSSSPAIARW